ncbi:hypothetical protein G9A89_003489 [Geosiphon pyriformis]|nr:hypothetical protein G9A89_003489 [Geosiphon pyriformis]
MMIHGEPAFRLVYQRRHLPEFINSSTYMALRVGLNWQIVIDMKLEHHEILASHIFDDIEPWKSYAHQPNFCWESFIVQAKEPSTAAKAGAANAQYSLGRCYEYGEELKENVFAALFWYQKSATHSHMVYPKAMRKLDRCYEIVY